MAWLTGWEYCKKIKVPASDIDGALSNFPLTVYLNEDNFDFTKCKADGADIRFTDKNPNQLKFERKEHNKPYATFDGSGDYFSVADSEDWDWNVENKTIEGWFNYNSTSQQFVINQLQTGNDFFHMGYGYPTAGVLGFHIHGGVSNPIISLTYTWTPDANYHHICVVKSGVTFTMYLDGMTVATATLSKVVPTFTAPLTIGGYIGSISDWFNGSISNLRITNSARYTSNFTPPDYFEVDDTDVVLCTNFDTELSGGTFQDDTGKTLTAYGNATNVMGNAVYNVQLPTVSATTDTEIYMWYGNANAYNASMEAWQDMTGKALTYNGNVKLQYDSTLGKRKAVFDGSGDYFTSPYSSALDFGTDDFCIEFLLDAPSFSANDILLAKQTTSGTNGWEIGTDATRVSLNDRANSKIIWTPAVNTADTIYVAICRASGVVTAYANRVAGTPVTDNASMDIGGSLAIGAYIAGSYGLLGNLLGLRITNGSTRDIVNNPQPTTFDIDGDDVVFCTNFDTIYDENYAMVQHMGDTLVDATGNGNNPTAVVGTTVVNTELGKARQFNGTSDYIRFNPAGISDFGTGEFTMLWLEYRTNTGVIVGNSATDYRGMVIEYAGYKLYASQGNISSYLITGWGMATNLLQNQIASHGLVRRNGTLYALQNESQFANMAFTGSIGWGTDSMDIGRYMGTAGNWFGGKLHAFSVSKYGRSDAWIKAESLALKNALVVITDFEKKGGSLFFGMNF